MNKISLKLLIIGLFAVSSSLHAGIQGRVIYDTIGIHNDTQANILIDGEHIYKPGEQFNIANKLDDKTPDYQQKKLITIYAVKAQQTVNYPYLTYGLKDGMVLEVYNSITWKVSELLEQHKKSQTLIAKLYRFAERFTGARIN